jgi:hypothetical protein
MFKKNISKILLAVSIFTSSLVASSIEITSKNLFVNPTINKVQLFHDDFGFIVKDEFGTHKVEAYNVDKEIRNVSSDQLNNILGVNNLQLIPLTQEQIDSIDMSQVIELTELEKEELLSKIGSTAYITVNRTINGAYILQITHRVNGGGIWGAIGGAWIGKFVASAVCHTVIWTVAGAVSLVATPAVGAIVGCSLESTFGAVIETTTTAAAMAAGIAGAVLTGPI